MLEVLEPGKPNKKRRVSEEYAEMIFMDLFDSFNNESFDHLPKHRIVGAKNEAKRQGKLRNRYITYNYRNEVSADCQTFVKFYKFYRSLDKTKVGKEHEEEEQLPNQLVLNPSVICSERFKDVVIRYFWYLFGGSNETSEEVIDEKDFSKLPKDNNGNVNMQYLLLLT